MGKQGPFSDTQTLPTWGQQVHLSHATNKVGLRPLQALTSQYQENHPWSQGMLALVCNLCMAAALDLSLSNLTHPSINIKTMTAYYISSPKMYSQTSFFHYFPVLMIPLLYTQLCTWPILPSFCNLNTYYTWSVGYWSHDMYLISQWLFCNIITLLLCTQLYDLPPLIL